MKVKFTLIPLIPAALAMIAFRVMSIFGADDSGKFLGMDKMAVAYTVIGIAVGLFVVCIAMNIFDRKTAPVYPVKKNFTAGVLSALSGALVIASSVASFMNNTVDSEYYAMTLVCAVFAIPAGIAFFLMARIHFVGQSAVSGVSMMFVFPALWGCTELVYEFLEATKVSISATDLTSLFCFIFFTLYYFSHAMVVSRIKGRNPVKACFIYGLPAVALGLSHGVYTFFTGMQEGGGYASSLTAGMLFVLALYALSFIIEMARNSFTKDELEIVDGLPRQELAQEEESQYIKTNNYDDLVFAEKKPEPEKKEASDEDEGGEEDEKTEPASDYYGNAQELDDFIIGYNAPQDEEPVPYLTHSEMKKTNDRSFVTGSYDSDFVMDTPQQEEAAEEVKTTLLEEPVFAPEPAQEPAPAPVEEPVAAPQPAPQAGRETKKRSAVEDLLKELDSKQ